MKTLLIICILSLALKSPAQFPDFEFHKIGEYGRSMGQTSLTDLDNDGDLDWIFGERGKLFWFEYQTADNWVFHKLGEGAKTDVGGCPIDINKDGMIDYMVGSGWYENTGSPKTIPFTYHEKWKFHLISQNSTGQDFHSLAVADFDNDGDQDVFSGGGPMSTEVHKWFIWENISSNAKKWKQHEILNGFRCHEAKAADVDGDGDIDICSKPWHGNIHVFMENKLK